MLCFLPIFIVLILSVMIKDTFISLFVGIVVGLIIIYGCHPYIIINQFIELLYEVLMSKNTIWVLLIILFFGALNSILENSGGINGVLKMVEKYCYTKTSTMMNIWVLGILIFISDYLSVLSVGVIFKDKCKEKGISKEMFSFLLNSTGTPVSSLMPLSDFSVYMNGLMVSCGLLTSNGLVEYIRVIPYIFYSIIAIMIVPFFIKGIIPLTKNMKRAENEAIKETANNDMKGDIKVFVIPMILLIFFSMLTNDILISVLIILVIGCPYYIIKKVMNYKEYFYYITKGMNEIFPVCITVVLSYILVYVNQQLGMIEVLSSILLRTFPIQLFPFIIFICIGIFSLLSGSFWGLAAITFPLLANIHSQLNINFALCSGALISAIVFGSQSCMYSDVVIMSSINTGLDNTQYFKTSFPMIMISFIITAIIYLISGIIF